MFSRFFGKADADAASGDVAHDELMKAVQDKSCVVVDVREPHEFASGHIPGAVNLPLSRFRPEQLPAGKRVVLICLSGARSASAMRHAHGSHAMEIRHYPRGMNGWRAHGGPIVR